MHFTMLPDWSDSLSWNVKCTDIGFRIFQVSAYRIESVLIVFL
jgi:hypothetical protein